MEKIYKFTGIDNATQLRCTLGNQVSYDEALEYESNANCEGCDSATYALPNTPITGAYIIFDNSCAGVRNIIGFIIASNEIEAIDLLKQLN